jgi:hypothetical protein
MRSLSGTDEGQRSYASEQERSYPRDLYPASRGLLPGLILGGLAVLALGAWAIQALGPDLARYLKIRNM